MPSRSRPTFSGLLSEPPAPLPDDDEPTGPTSSPLTGVPPAATPVPPVAAETPAPTVQLVVAEGPEPTDATPEIQTDGRELAAPTTIRLRKPAAIALRHQWLEEKRRNVLLSYPEFASEIVRLGLEAYQSRGRS